MTSVLITQNGTVGHFVPKVVVVVFIKDIEFVSMVILEIWDARPAKIKNIRIVKKIHVHTGDHGQGGVRVIKSVDVDIKSLVVVANSDTKIYPAVEALT